MKIGRLQDISTRHGDGKRLVIFFMGCMIQCEGCGYEKYFDYNKGVDWSIHSLITYIKQRLDFIDGITLSGGEPLNQPELEDFLETLRKDKILKSLNVWIYTGYKIDVVPWFVKKNVNVIIDGEHDKNKCGVKYRGSYNQKIWVKIQGKHFKEVIVK